MQETLVDSWEMRRDTKLYYVVDYIIRINTYIIKCEIAKQQGLVAWWLQNREKLSSNLRRSKNLFLFLLQNW